MDRKIFISHCAEDAEVANKIADLVAKILRLPRESLFFVFSDDHLSIAPGASILGTVRDALDPRCCSAVLALLTERSFRRPWIHFEAGAGFALTNQLIPVLLPGCPRDEEAPLYFKALKGIDLRGHDEDSMQSLFKALTKVMGRDGAGIDSYAKEFSGELARWLDELEQVQQVAAVCFKRDPAGDPLVLLVQSLDRSGDGIKPGNQRLFPKTSPRVGGKRVFSDSVAAMYAALTEAGVAVSIRGELGTFRHWKQESQKELKVKAILAEFVATKDTNAVTLTVPRAPQWFSRDDAVTEVGANRERRFAREYEAVIYDAFKAYGSA